MNKGNIIKRIMFGLSGMAYLALSVPAELKWIKTAAVLSAVIIICAVSLKNTDTYIREHAGTNKLVISVLLSMVLGLRFQKVWRYSQKVFTLSQRIGISETVLLYAVGIVLGILSIYFVLGAVCFLTDYPKTFFPDDRKDTLRVVPDKPMKLLLACLLLVQGINLVYWGSRKEGYHVDEVYTFELSNYKYTNFVDTERSYGIWITGDELHTIIEPDGSELFNITVPYWNSETDNHPMIYYTLVNFNSSVCRLLGIEVNKWTGLLPNFAASVASAAVLVYLFFKLTNNVLASVIAGAAVALSAFTASISVYLRMYALLILSCCVFVYLHYEFGRRVQNDTLDSRFMFLLELTTAAGILTQYYFLIFAFFMCLLTFISLLIKKKWVAARGYFVAEFAGVFLAELFFPRMFVRLFFGDRGTQAIQNISNGNFMSKLQRLAELIRSELFPSFGLPVLILVLVSLAVIGFRYIRSSEKNNTDGLFIVKLSAVIVMYCLIVAKIAPFMVDRYFACVFPFICFCILYCIYKAVCYAAGSLKKSSAVASAVLAAVVLIITADGYISHNVHYIYDNFSERRESIEKHGDLPVIVLNKDVYDDSSLKWINELENYSNVYLCHHGNTDDIEKAISNDIVSDRFLLYAHFYEENDNGLEDILGKYRPVLISSVGSCPVYYCEVPANE